MTFPLLMRPSTARGHQDFGTLGLFLRRAREKSHLSREDLARLSGVALRNIEALERGDLVALPSAVYGEGMVRAISRVLGVPESEVLERYRKRLAGLQVSALDWRERVPASLPDALEAKAASLPLVTPGRMAALGAMLLGGGVLLYMSWMLRPLFRAPLLVVDTLPGNVSVTQPDFVLSGRTESGSDLTVNGEPVYLDGEGRFQLVYVLQRGLNPIEVVSKSRFGRVARVSRYVIYSPSRQTTSVSP